MTRGIGQLILRTDALDALRRFYTQVLEFSLLREDVDSLALRAGETELCFRAGAEPGTLYHFAFNIPENKLPAAKRWLAPRCPLVRREDGADEYEFPAWNARAIYCLDPAGNIVEFIARHDLPNARPGDFRPHDILYASEIGLVVDDVRQATDAACRTLGLDVYRGSLSDQFAAVGDPHRLLIIVQRGRAWSAGGGRTASPWPVEALIPAPRPGRFESAEHAFAVVGV